MRNLLWITIIGFLFSVNAWPMDSWLCTEDSSQIQGSSILACGVGVGTNEAVARSQALRSAENEFSVICGVNTECGAYKYSATPSRATCQEDKDTFMWKCYRLIVYRIKEGERTEVDNRMFKDSF